MWLSVNTIRLKVFWSVICPTCKKLLLFCFLLFPVLAFAAEESRDSAESEASEPRGLVPSRSGEFSTGVFFGHILQISSEGESVFVLPTDPDYPRRVFYLDRRTLYTLMEDGWPRLKKFEFLLEGQKVAIRYFAKGSLALADEVFIVSGDFEPEAYQRRRASRRKKKGRLKEKEKEKKVSGEETGTKH